MCRFNVICPVEIMYILTIALVLLVWYLTNYYRWWKNIYTHIEKLPGRKRYPIVGTMYVFIAVPKSDRMEVLLNEMNRYPGVNRIWNGSRPEISISTPEHMEIILKSSTLLEKSRPYDLILPWLGEGLLIAKGAKWHLHRKLITPSFHFNILKSFMEVFVEKSKLLLEGLAPKSDTKFFDITSDIANCTLDIICETAMGVSVNAMSSGQSDFARSVHEFDEIFAWRFLRPYYHWNPIFYLTSQGRKFKKVVSILHDFSKNVIADRKREFYEKKRDNWKSTNDEAVLGEKQRLSFLDLLLEASADEGLLSDNDLREEVDTFIFEGHDTTTAAITWCLFLLGNYPDVQEKVYQEVKSILEGKPSPTTLNELNDMQYLECVIKETLRLYPSVPFIGRRTTEELEIDGYKIPRGVDLLLHIYINHRDPRHFPDPSKFDPDRFSPENSVGRHPYAFVPFSAGSRNCIGQKFAMYEEKTIIASIIKNYKITSQERHEDMKVLPGMILRPQNGINLKLEKRF